MRPSARMAGEDTATRQRQSQSPQGRRVSRATTGCCPSARAAGFVGHVVESGPPERGPATGSRPPVRRGRSRSACIANSRLGHADEGRGEGSEWLEAGLRGPATSGPGRGSSPGHQRAIAAQIRDEDSHRVDDSAHGSRRLRDGKTAVNHMWASTTSGCTPRPWSYMPTRLTSEAVIQKRPDHLEEVLPGDRLRWVAAGVLEAAKGFRLGKGSKDMPALVAVLRARDVRLGLGKSAL